VLPLLYHFIYEWESEETESSSNSSSNSNDDLYPGANISVADLTKRLSMIQSKHKISDACVGDILTMFASVLPLPNKCPSLVHYKEFLKPDELPFTVPVTGGICYILPFKEIVSRILFRYPYALQFHQQKTQSGMNDISDGYLFPGMKSNVLYFMLNTDGISPIRSRSVHVWPIILSLVNLKPSHRRLLPNLIMVSLYIGESQPLWSEILPHIVAELNSGLDFEGCHYTCDIICLIADMPAKSSICNIQYPTAK